MTCYGEEEYTFVYRKLESWDSEVNRLGKITVFAHLLQQEARGRGICEAEKCHAMKQGSSRPVEYEELFVGDSARDFPYLRYRTSYMGFLIEKGRRRIRRSRPPDCHIVGHVGRANEVDLAIS